MTSRGHPYAEFKRALESGNLWIAEAVAREMPHVSLEDALRLVHLYAERESPKFERAAIKWLKRYLAGALRNREGRGSNYGASGGAVTDRS